MIFIVILYLTTYMKKMILVSIIALLLSLVASMQVVNSISKPSACLNCHDLKHQNNSLFQDHSDRGINCIDCHSGQGIRGYVESREMLINAIVLEKSSPVLRYLYQNNSYNSSFIHLKPDCMKCHEGVKSLYFNHSDAANCTRCHKVFGAQVQPETGFWKKMGTGGHRNKTCEDCHTTGFRIPACTDCHIPHREGANWDNGVCLACHSSPHIPVKSGSFNGIIPKENCGACHNSAYETLTFYNSKHNQLSSCTYCHASHDEKKKCFDCHLGQHLSHPFARENCAACHGKAACKDCHTEPHAPLRLPKITTKDQFNNYAATRKGH